MEKGVVFYRNLGKGLYVVKINERYLVLESYDITAFKVGDTLYGQLDQCGNTDLLNGETQKWSNVKIHHIDCTEDMAVEKAQAN